MRARAIMVAWVVAWAMPARAVEDVKLEFDPQPKPETYSVKAEGVVDAPPAAVRHTLMHLCDLRDLRLYMRECVVFNTQGAQAWSYVLLNPPVIDARDYTVRRTVQQDLTPDGGGEMHMVFTQAHDSGPPVRPGIIRVQVNEGYWIIKPVDDGKKSMIVYSLTLNPGGSIPLWLARLAARRATPEQFSKIERVAQQQLADGKVVMPKAGSPWADVTPTPLPGAAIIQR